MHIIRFLSFFSNNEHLPEGYTKSLFPNYLITLFNTVSFLFGLINIKNINVNINIIN